MFDDNDLPDDQNLDDIVQRYEDHLKKKKPIFFDIDEFGSIIDFYLERNDIGNAIEATRIASMYYPGNSDIMIRQARLFLDKGKPHEALKLLKNASLISASDPDVCFMFGLVRLRMGNHLQAIRDFDEAIRLAGEGSSEMIFGIGYQLSHAGKFNLAVQYYEKLLEKDPGFIPALGELAYCCDRNGDEHRAIDLYKAFLEEEPFDENSWYSLGVLLAKQRRIEDAMEAFDYALAIDSQYLSAYLSKANMLFEEALYEEAVKIYLDYAEMDSDYPEIYYLIGECYENIGNSDKALYYYNIVLSFDDKHTDALLGIGAVHLQRQEYPESIFVLKKAFRNDPQNTEVMYSLAELYLKTGSFREGIDLINKALSLAPGEEDYWLLLSELQTASGNKPEALASVAEGLKAIPAGVALMYRYAGLLSGNRQPDEAHTWFEKACAIAPGMLSDFFEYFPDAHDAPEFRDTAFRVYKDLQDDCL